jgi:hypothetical protein
MRHNIDAALQAKRNGLMTIETLVFGAIVIAAIFGGIRISVGDINIGNKHKNNKTK